MLMGKICWKDYFLPKSFRRPVLQRQFPAVTFNYVQLTADDASFATGQVYGAAGGSGQI
jgi:hypothetical protein